MALHWRVLTVLGLLLQRILERGGGGREKGERERRGREREGGEGEKGERERRGRGREGGEGEKGEREKGERETRALWMRVEKR